MTILIDTEVSENIQSSLDIEKFGKRYKTMSGYYTFPDPNLEVLDKHLFFLLKNSVEIEFDKKYKYRPDYLSYNQYGTTMLWQILMYVNNVPSILDFDLVRVVIPSLDAITDILSDLYIIPSPDELDTINW